MAFLPPEQQNQYAPQGQTTGAGTNSAPPQTGGSAGAGSGASKAGGEPSSQGTSTQFGSSSSKLGDYLTANAPQIGAQAQTVANGLNTQYGQVSGDINNAANQFGQQVSQGYAAPNQDLVNQAVSNPTQFAATPSNVSGFQGQLNDTYSGPTSYESTTPYGNIQGEVNSAVQNAGLLNTQAGLQNYLGQTSGGNQTQASNTLDALLLSGNPDAQKTVQTAANQFNQLTPQFQNSVTNADQSVQAAQQDAQNAAAYAQQQAGNTTNQFNTQLQNELSGAQNAATTYNQQQQAAYNQLTPIQQWLNAYQGNSNVNIGNNPLTQYLNQTPVNAPTLAGVATSPQYQEAAALQQLLGTGYQSPLDQTAASQAGTYNTPTSNSYDLNNIIQQIAGGATTAQYNATQPQMTGLPGWEQSLVDTKSQPYQQLINELQTLDPNDFSQMTYQGKPVNPGNYIYGHQGQ